MFTSLEGPMMREHSLSSLALRRPSGVEPPADRPGRVVRMGCSLVAAAAAIFILGLVLGLVVVGHHGAGPIQGWDSTVERWYVHHRAPFVGVSKLVATYLDAFPLAVASVILTAILAITFKTIRALVPLVAYLGGEFQVFVLREIILRHRPPTANYPAVGAVPGVHETSYSFPSGHAVAVTAVLFALLGSVALARGIWWPWLIALVASLFVVDTRLVLGVHWFSDVAFGFVLGVVWGIVVAIVFRQLEWDDLRSFFRLLAWKVGARRGAVDLGHGDVRPGLPTAPTRPADTQEEETFTSG